MIKKRLLPILMAAMVTVGALTGCAKQATGGEEIFKSGKYEGTAAGFGGDIKVEVEVDANSIVAIKVLEHKESAGVSDPAMEKIPAEIVKNQTMKVDTVSGCTISSKGIIDAVKDALESTGADISKFEKKKSEADSASKEKIEKSADVVIIGAGGAGMSAAVETLKADSSVIVIEKMPAIGGNTIRAGSAYNTSNEDTQKVEEMSPSEMQKIKDILALEPENDIMKQWQETLASEIAEYEVNGSTYLFDSPTLHKLQTYYGGDYVGEPELIDILAENSEAGLDFLTGLGSEWVEDVNAAVGATWKRSHTPTPKYGSAGSGFVVPQVEFVEENGGEIMLDSKAEELIMEDGRCIGVKGTTTEGQPFEVKANKGVILATGGFGANVEMRQAYNKHWEDLGEDVQTTNHPGATGDGIVMAEKIGAELVGMEWIQLIPTYGPGVFTPYIENQFYVNKDGNRFVKEDGRRDELAKAILEQKDKQIYIISDANTIKDGLSKAGKNIDEMIGNGYAFKADTLEELAEQIGIPYETLQGSVDEFNNSVKTGNDPFGRQLFDKEFGVGPFYAGLTGPMVHHTMGGVKINEEAQVIDKDGNIIKGLYAAGEVTGGIHGSNRLGGNAIADITVFGRIAGVNAAAEEAIDK